MKQSYWRDGVIISALAVDERVADVVIDDDEISVRLKDGRTISVPIVWYPRLKNATKEQRNNWAISGGGFGIHWPDVDEDLSTAGFLRGAPAPHGREPMKTLSVVVPDIARTADENEEAGVWDLLTDAESTTEQIIGLMTTFSEHTLRLRDKVDSYADKALKIEKAGGSRTSSRHRGVTLKLATDFNAYSARLEEILPELAQRAEKLESTFSKIMDYMDREAGGNTAQRSKVVNSFKLPLETFISNFRKTKATTVGFHEGLLGLHKKNLSKELNKAINRLLPQVDNLLAIFDRMESFGLKMMFQLKEKFETQ